MSKIRVGVIYGGRSGEHEVSVLSANSVLSAIDKSKYEVIPIGITKEGQWLLGQSPAVLVESKELQVRHLGTQSELEKNSLMDLYNQQGQILAGLKDRIDIVFPVLHGPFGEDGTIQGLLELAGIPYVGCGVLASAVGMDKALMKAVFIQNGLPVGDFLAYLRKDWENDPEQIITEVTEKLGYPNFVKPANLGSSVGISKAHNPEELKKAIDYSALFDRKIVIEKMMTGREIECGVLGNDDPTASVCGEVVPCAEFYDYEAKYILNDSKLVIPVELPLEVSKKVQDLAVKAFKAVDGSGLSRVDFFVEPETSTVYVNEINTLPGFTRISMYPKLWEASGIGYSELIDRLIGLGMKRYEDKMRNQVG